MSYFMNGRSPSLLYPTETGVNLATFQVVGPNADEPHLRRRGLISYDRNANREDRAEEKTENGSRAITIRIEKSPAEFAHLFATVEHQIQGRSLALPYVEAALAAGSSLLGITSAVTGEGKTTVALHLAMNAAFQSNRQVCLIDLGMGDDDIGQRIGVVSSGSGVIGLLEGTTDTFPALQLQGCDNLVILPAGRRPLNPARAARSLQCGALFASVREQFDLVVVDLPAISTDNVLPLLAHLDSTLVVARSGATPRSVVRQALDQIGRDRVIGLALNQTRFAGPQWLKRWALGDAA